MMFRAVSSLMMEAVRTSETSVDNHFTRQYNPEDSSEQDKRRFENINPVTFVAVCDKEMFILWAVSAT
jgi:hypothetical protein